MDSKFLFDELDTLWKWGGIQKKIPDSGQVLSQC